MTRLHHDSSLTMLQVRAHRNSPSVLLWSLCNEEGCFEQKEDGIQARGNSIGAAMKQLILYHDGSRAVMAAMDHGAKYHTDPSDYPDVYPDGAGFPLSAVLDVQAFNYQYLFWDEWHALRPNQPMLQSESAGCTCSRGVYQDNFSSTAAHQAAKNCLELKGCYSVYGGITMEDAWQATASRKYMAGTARTLWCVQQSCLLIECGSFHCADRGCPGSH